MFFEFLGHLRSQEHPKSCFLLFWNNWGKKEKDLELKCLCPKCVTGVLLKHENYFQEVELIFDL